MIHLPDTDGGAASKSLATNRVDDGLRSAAATSGTAEDRAPETQSELTCTEYGQHYCHGIHDPLHNRCQSAIAKVHYSQSLSQRKLGLSFGYSGP